MQAGNVHKPLRHLVNQPWSGSGTRGGFVTAMIAARPGERLLHTAVEMVVNEQIVFASWPPASSPFGPPPTPAPLDRVLW